MCQGGGRGRDIIESDSGGDGGGDDAGHVILHRRCRVLEAGQRRRLNECIQES